MLAILAESQVSRLRFPPPLNLSAIVQSGEADVVLLARAELRDPYWPLHAAQALGAPAPWPAQYLRAKP